ncbi:hypothetical protein MMC13_003655 [Lambiella insularis]|nr:hypothetical protein [Lambiella insularis]
MATGNIPSNNHTLPTFTSNYLFLVTIIAGQKKGSSRLFSIPPHWNLDQLEALLAQSFHRDYSDGGMDSSNLLLPITMNGATFSGAMQTLAIQNAGHMRDGGLHRIYLTTLADLDHQRFAGFQIQVTMWMAQEGEDEDGDESKYAVHHFQFVGRASPATSGKLAVLSGVESGGIAGLRAVRLDEEVQILKSYFGDNNVSHNSINESPSHSSGVTSYVERGALALR